MNCYNAGMKNRFRFSMLRLFVAVTLFCFGVWCCIKDLPPHANTGNGLGIGFSAFAFAIGSLFEQPFIAALWAMAAISSIQTVYYLSQLCR
jgi:hypothetical protein